MNQIKYERLTINNINFIESELVISEDKYTKEDLIKFLTNPEHYIFIGKDGDKVVALLYGYGMSRPDGKNMFYIHSVDVIDDYQGKGIGTNLMSYTINFIKDENKYYKFFVLAETDNIRASKLYEKYAEKKEQLIFNGIV